MPRKPMLSPTRIRAYLECAVKYRYTYVDGLARYYRRARPEYSLGSTLHHVLQSFHAEGARATLEELAERLERTWISAGYVSAEQEAEFLAAGRDMVAAYQPSAADRVASGIETIATETTLRADMGRFVLTGRIDRLDRHPDGVLEIVDYKSGTSDVAPEDVAGSLAMSVYQLLVRRGNPGVRVMASIVALRSGRMATAEMADRDADRFSEWITVLGEEIIDRDLTPITPVRIDACEFCDFLPRCERFWAREAIDS